MSIFTGVVRFTALHGGSGRFHLVCAFAIAAPVHLATAGCYDRFMVLIVSVAMGAFQLGLRRYESGNLLGMQELKSSMGD